MTGYESARLFKPLCQKRGNKVRADRRDDQPRPPTAMDAIFSFSLGDFALIMPGHAKGSPAPVAVILLMNDRRETVIGMFSSWILPLSCMRAVLSRTSHADAKIGLQKNLSSRLCANLRLVAAVLLLD